MDALALVRIDILASLLPAAGLWCFAVWSVWEVGNYSAVAVAVAAVEVVAGRPGDCCSSKCA